MRTRMLWYKAWLDTRWRFLIGLGVLALATAGCVLAYPRAMQVIAAVGNSDEAVTAIVGSNPIARENIALTLQLAGTYRGFVWSQLFHNELPQLWCLFAIVIGSGGIVSQASRGEGLFSLSLPVSRQQLVMSRAGVALAELLALAVVPALLVPLLSPAVQQSYSATDAIVHGLFLFGGGTVFFSAAFVLSSIFESFWVPPLVMLAIAGVLTFARAVNPALARYSLAPILSAEGHFRGTGLPWLGLLILLAVSAGFLVLAMRNIARRDF
jgi:ABC-2 type transport system permease protein